MATAAQGQEAVGDLAAEAMHEVRAPLPPEPPHNTKPHKHETEPAIHFPA